MFSKYSLLFFVLNIFVFCESGFLDTLPKCKNIEDSECAKNLVQKVVADYGSTGVPELGIRVLDPASLANITVEIKDIIEITLIEGIAKGIKKCKIDRFEVNIENERLYADFTCDITIKGKYKVFSASPVLKSLLNGESVHGEGNGKIKIEKLKLKIDLAFHIQKRDGEYYIKCDYDKTNYHYDIKGKVSFFADKLYVGEVESSKLVVGLLNENWKLLMTSFGKPFMDKAMMLTYGVIETILDNTPVKYFIEGDLSSYVRA